MEETEKFTDAAIRAFINAEGKTLYKVVCHLWQNVTNPAEPVEVIDNLQLHFGGDDYITIACTPSGTGLDVINYDFEIARTALQNEFGGRIRLFAVDASGTTIWKDTIGKNIAGIRLTKEGESYIADSLVLDFGEEKREIAVSPLDGLIVDIFEI
jgi:hypothetical protein